MHSKFCPRCHNIIIPKRVGEVKYILKCSNCSFFKKVKGENLIRTDKIKKEEIGEGVVKDENEFATYDHNCNL